MRCVRCDRHYDKVDGIWRLLSPERQSVYHRFLEEYHTVREREGWGGEQRAYYQRLPQVPPDDPQRAIWDLRVRTYRALTSRVIAPRESVPTAPRKILDVGAGNCWLAYRLAERGDHVLAIDLSLDAHDGLGAHVNFEPEGRVVVPVQAEFDRIPLADREVDIIVFNGSFHYSTNYDITLREATRVLRPDGTVVIMDSPVYRHASSGAQMVREREERFTRLHGFPSNALASENFLTWMRLEELGSNIGLSWQMVSPYLGVQFTLRRWKTLISGNREPARFPLIVGSRGQ